MQKIDNENFKLMPDRFTFLEIKKIVVLLYLM